MSAALSLQNQILTCLKTAVEACELVLQTKSMMDSTSTDLTLQQDILDCVGEVAQGLHQSSINKLRNFVSPMMTSSSSSSSSLTDYNPIIDKLQTIFRISQDNLNSEPDEESRKASHAKRLLARAKQLNEQWTSLNQNVIIAEKELEEESRKRALVIEDLEFQIESIGNEVEKQQLLIQNKCDEQAENIQTSLESKYDALQQEVVAIEKTLSEVQNENRKTEKNLRQKLGKVREEVRTWIEKYDETMFEKQQEIDSIEENMSKEKEQFEQLQSDFNVLEKEYNDIMHARKIEREQREKEEARMKQVLHAVEFLQLLWKFKLHLKKKKKKAKKGGKKGKKK